MFRFKLNHYDITNILSIPPLLELIDPTHDHFPNQYMRNAIAIGRQIADAVNKNGKLVAKLSLNLNTHAVYLIVGYPETGESRCFSMSRLATKIAHEEKVEAERDGIVFTPEERLLVFLGECETINATIPQLAAA